MDRKPVDDMISAVPGNWQFDEPVARSFDQHVRKSVPLYDQVQQLVVELSEFFIRDGAQVVDLGSSTGETLKLLAEHHAAKSDLSLTGIELSETMVEEAKIKCSALDQISFAQSDIGEYEPSGSVDFAYSLYTLQFLDPQARFDCIKRVYDHLKPGGAFVFVDKVYAENAHFEYIANEIHWDFKRSQGLSDDMILDKAKSLRGVLLPMSCGSNFEMLAKAGFQHIDLFFKYVNFAGLIGIKDPNS